MNSVFCLPRSKKNMINKVTLKKVGLCFINVMHANDTKNKRKINFVFITTDENSCASAGKIVVKFKKKIKNYTFMTGSKFKLHSITTTTPLRDNIFYLKN